MKFQPEVIENASVETNENMSLILWNDDHNSFDYVIDAIISICGHEQLQAEQCALLAHTNGKAVLKKGNFTLLNQMDRSFAECGITTSVV